MVVNLETILKAANRGFGKKQSNGYVEWDDAIIAMKEAVRQATKTKKQK